MPQIKASLKRPTRNNLVQMQYLNKSRPLRMWNEGYPVREIPPQVTKIFVISPRCCSWTRTHQEGTTRNYFPELTRTQLTPSMARGS